MSYRLVSLRGSLRTAAAKEASLLVVLAVASYAKVLEYTLLTESANAFFLCPAVLPIQPRCLSFLDVSLGAS